MGRDVLVRFSAGTTQDIIIPAKIRRYEDGTEEPFISFPVASQVYEQLELTKKKALGSSQQTLGQFVINISFLRDEMESGSDLDLLRDVVERVSCVFHDTQKADIKIIKETETHVRASVDANWLQGNDLKKHLIGAYATLSSIHEGNEGAQGVRNVLAAYRVLRCLIPDGSANYHSVLLGLGDFPQPLAITARTRKIMVELLSTLYRKQGANPSRFRGVISSIRSGNRFDIFDASISGVRTFMYDPFLATSIHALIGTEVSVDSYECAGASCAYDIEAKRETEDRDRV